MIHPLADCEHPLLCLLGPGIVSHSSGALNLPFEEGERRLLSSSSSAHLRCCHYSCPPLRRLRVPNGHHFQINGSSASHCPTLGSGSHSLCLIFTQGSSRAALRRFPGWATRTRGIKSAAPSFWPGDKSVTAMTLFRSICFLSCTISGKAKLT